MLKILNHLGRFTVWGWIGINPGTAVACSMLLMGVGGDAVVALLTPPSTLPQPSAWFTSSAQYGSVNVGLKTNGGSAGAFTLATNPTTSWNLYAELTVPPDLGGFQRWILGNTTSGMSRGLGMSGGGAIVSQWGSTGTTGGGFPWWLPHVGVQSFTSVGQVSHATTTNLNPGIFTWAAADACDSTMGAGAREPNGVVEQGTVTGNWPVDPGFLCSMNSSSQAPQVIVANIPGAGYPQTPSSLTCASNTPAGQIQVTLALPVAHGLGLGQSFTLSGYTPSAYNQSYIVQAGSSGTTLVGTAQSGSGTCPGSVTGVGTLVGGSGGAITISAPVTTNSFSFSAGGHSGTGIVANSGQRLCLAEGQFAEDSYFPGAHWMKVTTADGADVSGSPAVSPWLNLGTMPGFTGYTTINATTTPQLNVTAVTSFSIMAASYAASSGSTPALVTFTTNATDGFTVGSEFTVSGMTPSGYNQTYVAVAGTSGSTVVGNPLSGVIGTPQALSNPGAATGFGSMVGVLMPGMYVVGATGGSIIQPFGMSGATGRGGTGTYTLTNAQATFTVSGSILASGNTLTVTGTPATLLTTGTQLSLASPAYTGTITGLETGSGRAGTYTVSPANGATPISAASFTAGPMWSSGSPGNMTAAASFYYTIAPSAAAGGMTLTKHSNTTMGDVVNLIGTESATATIGSSAFGWGGAIGNLGMFEGVPFPMSATGQPDSTSFNDLCGKTYNYQSWIAAHAPGGAWRSFYALNDPGIYADSSLAQFTGTVSGTNLTILSTQAGTTTSLASGVVIGGAGLCAASTCPTIVSGSGSSYVLSSSFTISTGEAMTAGTYNPATPLTQLSFNGQLAGSTLTVNSLISSWAGTASMAAPSPSSPLSGTVVIASTSSGAPAVGQCFHDSGVKISETAPLCITAYSAPNATVDATYYPNGIPTIESMTTSVTSIVPGQYVMGAGIATPIMVTGYGTGIGYGGTYSISSSANGNVGAETMNMSGVSAGGAIAPGAALTVKNPGSGNTYPITIGSTTGQLQLTGTYSTALLEGTPSHIQTQVNTTPFVNPLGAWTNVSNESIGGGNWSGTVTGVPLGGPYWVFIQAANGPGYATLPTPVFVGASIALFGEGNTSGYFLFNPAAPTIQNQTHLTGQSQIVGFASAGASVNGAPSSNFVPGPAIVNNFTISTPAQTLADNFGVNSTSMSPSDGVIQMAQAGAAALGGPISVVNMTKDGTGFQQLHYGGSTQTQTIGVGDGSTKSFSSGPGFGGAVPGVSPATTTVTATVSASTGIMNVTAKNNSLWSFLDVGDSVSCASCVTGGAAYSGIITALGGPWAPSLTGSGSTGTYQLSPIPSAAIASSTLTIRQNNLSFNGAWTFGATFTAHVLGNTLTVDSLTAGALAPNLTLTGTSVGGRALTTCLTGCGPLAGVGSTWTVSGASLGTIATEAMSAAPSSGALYPSTTVPTGSPVDSNGGGSLVGSQPMIEQGTFEVLVNGSVVCADTATPAYNIQQGNCTGAGVSGAINYATGAYLVNFTSAPAGGVPVVAQWTNIMSANATSSPSSGLDVIGQQFDWVGSGPATSGVLSSVASKQGGIVGFVNGQQFGGGWPDNMLQEAKGNNYAFGTRLAALNNGQAQAMHLGMGQPRGVGMQALLGYFAFNGNYDDEQYYQDQGTDSEFNATITGAAGGGPWTATLTLTGAATGLLPNMPMWEGEIIECNPYSTSCGLSPSTEILNLISGTWGASGSTYAVTSDLGAFSTLGATAFHNAMYSGGAYVGPMNDLVLRCGGPTGGYCVEPGGGMMAGLRIGHRMGLEAGAALAGTPQAAMAPTVNRSSGSPSFNDGTTYQATATAGLTSTTAVATVTGGLSSGQRPFVPGMALSCSGCNSGLFVVSVDAPPTQSAAAGAGQVGQTFHITASGNILATGTATETLTGGCLGTPGIGSSCVDIKIDINTTGTYGTAAALQTCGVNNLVGANTNAPATATYIYPSGQCVPTGVGSLVRGFRIGTQQVTDAKGSGGSTYDWGIDPGIATGAVLQSSAFTCQLVDANVVECVKGPIYTAGVPALGQWSSGSTFVSYGDPNNASGFMSGLMGYPGGQSFPYRAGSGQANGHFVTGGVCTLATGGGNSTQVPTMGYDVSGGAIINAYLTTGGSGVNTTCTFPLNFTGTAKITSSSGINATFTPSVLTGGVIATGEIISIGAQTLTVKPVQNAGGTGVGYAVQCATTCSNLSATSFSVGTSSGTPGTITTPPLGPLEGIGGVATFDTDNNMTGTFLYDNSGAVGNPWQHKFDLPGGGVEAPGLGVRPFGMRRGAQVSG